jgi:hypothetical protein
MNWQGDTGFFDMKSLMRLASWGAAATAALSLVVLSAYSDSGSRRLAITVASLKNPGTPQAPASPNTAQLAARAAEAENETRRLSDALRTLATDRERLVVRISALERNLEDVTGSIKRQAALAPAPAADPAPPQRVTDPVKPEAGAPDSVASAPPAASPITSAPAAPTEPVAVTQFGIEIGGAASFDGLRTLWNSARSNQAALFEGLHPMVTVRENAQTRAAELRLIVGPVATPDAAAKLCAPFVAARRYCQPTTFAGQRLALSAPTPAPTSERKAGTPPQPKTAPRTNP